MSTGRLGRRLGRILLLLPYAIRHPGVTVDELAERFDVPRQDVLDDLDLVFLCGLPGYGPGDLIDVALEEDRVYVHMADYFKMPFRLTPGEALALFAGGKSLVSLPEMQGADALRSALDKLGEALGHAGADVEILLEGGAEDHLRTINAALADRKRVRVEYLSAGKAELTDRAVDPWGLVAMMGRWYLVGFDHLREDERMFRLDRIRSVTVLDESAEPPDDFDPTRYSGAFVAADDQPVISFEISPDVARWFAGYYPVRDSRPLKDGWTYVELVASGDAWASGLLLRLGDGVRAIAPPEMHAKTVGLAEAIASRYR